MQTKHCRSLRRSVGYAGVGLLVLFSQLAPLPAAEPAWKDLFNGKTLDGWTQRGGKAKYAVEDGAVVGTTAVGTPNSFLCTDRDYGDFILELEYKVDPKMNSGVQFRSQSLPGYKRGQVHGYQIEIDPSSRAWSAGIYDEGRRGWLYSLEKNPAAQKAFKQNEWNHYRIEAIGDSIRTWINGVPAADLRDAMTLSGFIALQVHGTSEKEPMQVRWRNIRIQDLGRHTWKPLFDGKSLAGWDTLPGGQWKVVDGVILGTSDRSEPRHGLLATRERYDDFTVRLKFKVTDGDSGFYFRSEKVPGPVGVHGFQVEIDTTYETGGLYETGGRNWVVQYKPEEEKKWYHRNAWNDLTVSAHGRRTVVHLNGEKTAELTDDPGRTSGHLALQLHGGMDMHVEYKDIELLVKAE